jgi:hypothetical protein
VNHVILWSGLSESNRHLNLGKVREVKSNALERRHLAFFGQGLNWKMMENERRSMPAPVSALS